MIGNCPTNDFGQSAGVVLILCSVILFLVTVLAWTVLIGAILLDVNADEMWVFQT